MYAVIRTDSVVENNVFTPEVMVVDLKRFWVDCVDQCIEAARKMAGSTHLAVRSIDFDFELQPCWQLAPYDTDATPAWNTAVGQKVAAAAAIATGNGLLDGIVFVDKSPTLVMDDMVDTEFDRLVAHVADGQVDHVTFRAYVRKTDEEFTTVRIPLSAVTRMRELSTEGL